MTNVTNHKSKNVASSQAKAFKAMAHELECDDSNVAFDAKLKALAKAQDKPAKGK